MRKVHASLFSGFGAADLAATWMGWDNAFWCEIDDFPRTVLSYWFPNSEKYGNIKETDFTPWRGKIDVLTGGFPCQPFSCAGQRKGQADDRYLWPEMLRAIREIRPTWVIGENVGGIISMVQPGSEIEVEYQASIFEKADKETLLEQEYVVETVCCDLEQEGYSVQPIVIPACAVSAPHRRDRIFFVAYSEGCGNSRTSHETSGEIERQNWDKAKQFKLRGEIRTASNGTNPGAESMQREGENGICKSESVTDPDGKRCDNRCDHRQERYIYHDQERNTQEDQPERAERKCRTCENGSATANSQRFGCGQILYDLQSRQPNGISIDSIGGKRIITYASRKQSEWLQSKQRKYSKQKQREFRGRSGKGYSVLQERGSHERKWQDFPTQSPVCRGNDGLPFDVVRLSIPFNKWREGSVKGYGNAIVPQVMYEIFKAIEKVTE